MDCKRRIATTAPVGGRWKKANSEKRPSEDDQEDQAPEAPSARSRAPRRRSRPAKSSGPRRESLFRSLLALGSNPSILQGVEVLGEQGFLLQTLRNFFVGFRNGILVLLQGLDVELLE